MESENRARSATSELSSRRSASAAQRRFLARGNLRFGREVPGFDVSDLRRES